MRFNELTEGKSTPCIVVDIQPEYTGINDGDELYWIDDMMKFLNKQKSPIFILFNGEELTADSESAVKEYYEDSGFTNWQNATWYDKGYGYLREAMDSGIDEGIIVKSIREMYRQKINDSRELFAGDETELLKFFDEDDSVVDIMQDGISVDWVSVSELKKHQGYIMGGGRDECLREVELIMSAFNFKHKQIKEFIYG